LSVSTHFGDTCRYRVDVLTPSSLQRGDEDEAVGLRDRGGPSLHNLVLVRRATRRGRRCRLIEERHRKVAKIEKPSVDTRALLQVFKIHFAGFSAKRPSRVLPTMTEMTVMLLPLTVSRRKNGSRPNQYQTATALIYTPVLLVRKKAQI
jgi:hypothetical protein